MIPNVGIPITNGGDMRLNEQVITEGLVRLHAPLLTGNEEIQQALAIRLLTRIGEDVIEPTMGLPIPQMIKANDDSYNEAAIRACILQDPRVASIGAMTLRREASTRRLLVTFTAILKDGTAVGSSASVGL